MPEMRLHCLPDHLVVVSAILLGLTLTSRARPPRAGLDVCQARDGQYSAILDTGLLASETCLWDVPARSGSTRAVCRSETHRTMPHKATSFSSPPPPVGDGQQDFETLMRAGHPQVGKHIRPFSRLSWLFAAPQQTRETRSSRACPVHRYRAAAFWTENKTCAGCRVRREFQAREMNAGLPLRHAAAACCLRQRAIETLWQASSKRRGFANGSYW